ncbi:hypothetical protein [Pseudomonas sp. MRSN 12121]|uniref:hypothetical protein n=1 Tax=Pseudomonas sp. MRSN 12121 TaxID=1611770 RepID=UPI0005BEEC67|nr:hypothetical protein [Pseudomonas sp. MRSN 12121]AJO81035.1 hypothetical protein TO66_28635 [Pseudomonas sp. MRSN 12121]
MTTRLQKTKMEIRMALLEQRLDDLVSHHESVPGRVTRLESEFKQFTAELAALNEGQRVLTATVADIGTKVTRVLAIISVLAVVAQMVVPVLLRMVFP